MTYVLLAVAASIAVLATHLFSLAYPRLSGAQKLKREIGLSRFGSRSPRLWRHSFKWSLGLLCWFIAADLALGWYVLTYDMPESLSDAWAALLATLVFLLAAGTSESLWRAVDVWMSLMFAKRESK